MGYDHLVRIMKIKTLYDLGIRRLQKKPFYITFDVTTKCNSKCKSCVVWKQDRNEMTLNEIDAVLTDLYDFGIRFVAIEGGEPFIRKDIFDIFSLMEEKGLMYNFATNGLLLNESKIKRLRDFKPNNFVVSLDSLNKKKYYQIRGSDELEVVIRNIHKFSEILSDRTTFRILTVVSALNYKEVYDILNFSKTVNAQFSAVPCNTGSGFEHRGFDDLLTFGEKEKEKVRDIFIHFSKLSGNGHPVFGTTNFFQMAAEYVSSDLKRPCDANKYILHLHSDGTIAVCHDMPPFGNLKMNKINDIWAPGLWSDKIKKCYSETPCFYYCTRFISTVIEDWKGFIEYFTPKAVLNTLKNMR